MAASGVIVWEWQNEYGSWRPYDPKISTFMEANKGSNIPLQLGSIDPKLYLYVLDMNNMCQIRQGTGTQRPIRRTVHASTSPLAKGITWQWEGDVPGIWVDFDTAITEFVEDCYTKKQTFVDLSKSQFSVPYHLDLQTMTQKRIETGRLRNIQRVFTSTAYPLDLSNNGGKKRSAVINKNASTKRSKQASSTVSNTISGFLPAINNSSVVTPNTLSNPFSTFSQSAIGSSNSSHTGSPSVIQFGGGPLTRSRYSNITKVPATSAPASSQTFNPGQQQQQQQSGFGVPVINPLTNGNNHSPFLHGFMTSNNIGFQPSMFASGPSLNPAHSGLPGGSVHFPQQHSYMSVSSSSAGQQPNLLHQSVTQAPSYMGSKSSRIRPTAAVSTSAGAPTSPHIPPSQPLKPERIPNFTHKSHKKAQKQVVSADDILQSYVSVLGAPPADQDCCICYEKLIEASGHGTGSAEDRLVLQLEKCSHIFHKYCLIAMYDSGSKDGSLQCPSCKTIYGEKLGNCPRGEMEYRIIHQECSGYPGCNTIQVMYTIPSGTQGPDHPNPGKRYSTRGFPRVGFLPDCDKGRKVLALLVVAWKRRITFTIGSSTTTGEDNTVTWNEIHHKTELGTNYSGHGFPDDSYLDNVLGELAVHGITEKDLPPS